MTVWGFIAHSIIILPSSPYDFNNVERNVKHQTLAEVLLISTHNMFLLGTEENYSRFIINFYFSLTSPLLVLYFHKALDKMLFCLFFFYPKVLIFFLFLHKNMHCRYSLEAPLLEYPQRMFSWRNKKNICLIPSLI